MLNDVMPQVTQQGQMCFNVVSLLLQTAQNRKCYNKNVHKKLQKHLILKGGKLLQYVTQFVSLACSVVSVNLDEAAEGLWDRPPL